MGIFRICNVLFSGVLVLAAGQAFAANPLPDIKANGSNGRLTINTGDRLSVTVALDAGTAVGTNSDWWVVADTPIGPYHYDLRGWKPGKVAAYQGQLADLAPIEVLNMSGLPAGDYVFNFGVDVTENGEIDFETGYYDTVDVSVTEEPKPGRWVMPTERGHYFASAPESAVPDWGALIFINSAADRFCRLMEPAAIKNWASPVLTGRSLPVSLLAGRMLVLMPVTFLTLSPTATLMAWNIPPTPQETRDTCSGLPAEAV